MNRAVAKYGGTAGAMPERQLIERYARLLDRNARRLSARTGHAVPAEDLWSAGDMGLIEAHRRFDAARDVIAHSGTISFDLPIRNTERAVGTMLGHQVTTLHGEHGLAPDAKVRSWQNRLDPLWGKIAGGCHINRDVPKMLTDAGLLIREIDTMYLPGPRPLTYNYWGRQAFEARPQ